MRKIVAISALSVVGAVTAGVVAVSLNQSRAPREVMTADLERDLNLASSVRSTRTGVVSALEQFGNGPSASEPNQRAVALTNKRAPSAAKSKFTAQVAVAPPVQPDAAVSAPAQNAPPVDVAASSSEAVAKAAAPEPGPAEPEHAAAGRTVSGGVTVGERGAEGTGAGDESRTADGRGDDVPGELLPPPPPPPRRPSGVVGVILQNPAIIRGGRPGVDHCEPRPMGIPSAGGNIGGMNDVLANGQGMPPGTFPNRPAGTPSRRW